jgi:hypothetical protein
MGFIPEVGRQVHPTERNCLEWQFNQKVKGKSNKVSVFCLFTTYDRVAR